ncbi:MAG: SDR family NAD(P)-dependent oxidoreductase [Paracoccaceae bacterium]
MDLQGKTALMITGANTGLGFEMARSLARAGAHVVLAGARSGQAGPGDRAHPPETPDARLEPGVLDLDALSAVAAFSDGFARRHARLDLLINSARA